MGAEAPHVVVNPILIKWNKVYFLLGIFLLAGLHFLLLDRALQRSASESLSDALITWLSLGFAVFLVLNTLSFYHPANAQVWIALIASAVLTFILVEFQLWLLQWGELTAERSVWISQSAYLRYAFNGLVLLFSFTFGLIWYRLGEREDLLRRQAEHDRLNKEAELYKLRLQLQPHFLFNSLNSINALVKAQPQKAREMILQLSEFLRNTLKADERSLVPLSGELEHLQRYLEIERVRFGNRLQLQLEISDAVLEDKLPPLILQPLVENAIKFGLYGTLDQSEIRLQALREDNHLRLILTNGVDADAAGQGKGTGFGLASVSRRLQLIYGRVDLLQTKLEAQKFSVSLRIPLYD